MSGKTQTPPVVTIPVANLSERDTAHWTEETYEELHRRYVDRLPAEVLTGDS